MSLTLTDATAADAKPLARILGDWVRETGWMPVLHDRAADRAFLRRMVASHRVLVARDPDWYFRLVPTGLADTRVPGATREELTPLPRLMAPGKDAGSCAFVVCFDVGRLHPFLPTINRSRSWLP